MWIFPILGVNIKKKHLKPPPRKFLMIIPGDPITLSDDDLGCIITTYSFSFEPLEFSLPLKLKMNSDQVDMANLWLPTLSFFQPRSTAGHLIAPIDIAYHPLWQKPGGGMRVFGDFNSIQTYNMCTSLKTKPSQKEISSSNHHLTGAMLVSRRAKPETQGDQEGHVPLFGGSMGACSVWKNSGLYQLNWIMFPKYGL